MRKEGSRRTSCRTSGGRRAGGFQMTNRSLGALGVIASVIVVVSLAAIPRASQAPAPEPNSWSPPLLPDGQPNMQGMYVPNWRTTVPIERWTDEHRVEYRALLAERYDVGAFARGRSGGGPSPFSEGTLQGDSPDTVMVVDPPDGKIPYQPWAAAKRKYMKEHLYDREEFISTRTRCFPAGAARDLNMGSNYNGWHVVQAPGVVIILTEWNHTYRIIRLDGRPHVGPHIELWMGDSRGHWEGNTLVVDATNFTDKTWVVGEIAGDGPSNNAFHSPALHLQERFTLVDANHIDYEATIEDPNVFTRPWTLRRKLWKRAEEGYVLFEYACHEGNIGWENMKEGLFGKPSAR